MKKGKLIRIIIALAFAALALFAYSVLTQKNTTGDNKVVTIEIMVDNETIYSANNATNRDYLGDLLDDLNKTGTVRFEFSGEKDGPMGRMIMGINEYVSDPVSGPWWMIYSETNKDALAQGYCNGADTQTIYDHDIFTLKFEKY